jgi:hypothetical protein
VIADGDRLFVLFRDILPILNSTGRVPGIFREHKTAFASHTEDNDLHLESCTGVAGWTPPPVSGTISPPNRELPEVPPAL